MKAGREISLKEKVSLLPRDPGVYNFLDSSGEVIYVGKAKDLRKRVASYFLAAAGHAPKVRAMVRHIADIRHTVVNSESEALLLENNMIKELRPRYNILLKDDKTYPWIVITAEPFPRILSTRNVVRDGSKYFGPYSAVYYQKQLLETLHSVYQLRTCRLNLSPQMIARGKYSPCLEYHIGNCKAPCVGLQGEEEYDRGVALAEKALKGDAEATSSALKAEMRKASGEMRFEDAEWCRKRLAILDSFHEKSVVVGNRAIDADIFALVSDETVAFCNFTRIVRGAVVNSFSVELKPGAEDSREQILAYAMGEIRDRYVGPLAHEIIVPFLPEQTLFEGHVFIVPRRGDKLKLLELAEKNCRLFRLERIKQAEIKDPDRRVERVMADMQKELHLSVEPRHIECFDNSNLQGTNPVASCVVFRDGKPAKSEYRHFNVKTVVGADDYATMAEIVGRRYRRMIDEGAELPQLIVVDGGKGQLGVAHKVISDLGIVDRVAIIGLAKRIEEVFFPNDPVPYYIDRHSETLKVLMHIRDEAHRFGITFHRQKRSKAFIKSELDSIPGIGKTSAEALLRRFRTVAAIRKASPEALASVVGPKRAEEIRKFFDGGEGIK